MISWQKETINGLDFYQSKQLEWLPGVVHGFTTRNGGVSTAPYDSLNMSLVVGDAPKNVLENRSRAARALAGDEFRIMSARQCHGDSIAVATSDGPDDLGEVDALITQEKGLLLLLLFADCVPVFLCDPIHPTVSMVHSGWKGTALNIAGKTAAKLLANFGCERDSIFASIGPCISGKQFQVDRDVIDALNEAWPGGSLSPFTIENEFTSKWRADLRAIVFDQLIAAGLKPENVSVTDQCVATNSEDFFSFRRDSVGGAPSGRMAGLIGLK
jgi:YfiH family protein